MLENFVPPYNATVMERLNREGTVMVGKLNMDEFAMGSSCEHPILKRRKTHTIRSMCRAAAQAAVQQLLQLERSVCFARFRYRWFHPSAGILLRRDRIKTDLRQCFRYGLVAFASSLDQIGPFGRCVADVAMTYSAICGHDPYDATSANRAYPQFTVGGAGDMKGKVIGIPKEYFGLGVSAEVHDRVMKAAELFEKNGAVLKEVSLPSTPYALSAYYIISSAEGILEPRTF